MLEYQVAQGATEPTERQPAMRIRLDFGQTTKTRKHIGGCLKALLRSAFPRSLVGRQSSAGLHRQLADFVGPSMLRQYLEQIRQRRRIRLRKKTLGFRCQLVDQGWPPLT